MGRRVRDRVKSNGSNEDEARRDITRPSLFVDERYKAIGRTFTRMRWIDISRGVVQNPNYRSRLVAREIYTHRGGDFFAATSPLKFCR